MGSQLPELCSIKLLTFLLSGECRKRHEKGSKVLEILVLLRAWDRFVTVHVAADLGFRL